MNGKGGEGDTAGSVRLVAPRTMTSGDYPTRSRAGQPVRLAHRTDRRRRRPSVRVRRRRLVAGSVVLVTVALSVPFGLSGGGPLAASGQPAGRATHTVVAGDTLWTLAERVDPGGDPRPIVQALSDELQGDRLRVGERITLP